jgi:hypothetical protein
VEAQYLIKNAESHETVISGGYRVPV